MNAKELRTQIEELVIADDVLIDEGGGTLHFYRVAMGYTCSNGTYWNDDRFKIRIFFDRDIAIFNFKRMAKLYPENKGDWVTLDECIGTIKDNNKTISKYDMLEDKDVDIEEIYGLCTYVLPENFVKED